MSLLFRRPDELFFIIDDFVHLLFGQLLADRTVLTVISAIVFAIAITTSSLSIAFCSPVIAGYSAKKKSSISSTIMQ